MNESRGEFMSSYSHILSIENTNERSAVISNMVSQSIEAATFKDMLAWATQEAQGLMFSRSVLNEFILQLKTMDENTKYDLLLDGLNICSLRMTAFEEQVCKVFNERYHLLENTWRILHKIGKNIRLLLII